MVQQKKILLHYLQKNIPNKFKMRYSKVQFSKWNTTYATQVHKIQDR